MSAEVTCPRCGANATEMVSIDGALAAKIKSEAGEDVPGQICSNCYSQLAGGVARGSVLLAREKAKEKKKVMMWKSRVGLIKKARQYMQDKSFSDAAVTYEKYIKVLEVVLDCKSGELTPEMFKDSARTQELTVVASVYWDLLRIYDTSERYGERMNQAATKLARFLRFTPIYPDIIRKAESFLRSAKNPNVIKNFIKMAGGEKGRCFIATSAFSDPWAPEVLDLTQFKELYLRPSLLGRGFINLYYLISPPIARLLDLFPALKPAVRLILKLILRGINPALRHVRN